MAKQQSKSYFLSGRITSPQGKPIEGLIVRAFDLDPTTPEDQLGEPVVTNAEGLYSITFTDKDFAGSAAEKGPDVLIRVYKEQKLLAESEVRYNSDEKINIDLQLGNIDVDQVGQTFTVSGVVTNVAKEPLAKQTVVLVDIDLLSSVVYKTISKVTDIEKSNIEILGKAVTNYKGTYTISFGEKAFASQERELPDAVAYVVSEDDIVGRSLISTKNDWASETVLKNLDVKIESTNFKNETEYALVMQAIMPLVEGAKIELYQLHASIDQIQFLAQEAEQELLHVSLLIDAAKRVSECPNDLSHELLYGIGRQQITLSWPVLYKRTDKELRTAIEKSVKEKIIKKYDEKQIMAFLKLIHECAAAYILTYKGNNQAASLEKLLSAALPKKEQQLAFVNAYRNFKSQIAANEIIDYKKFWRKYLPAVKEFKGKPELIRSLLFTQQLSIISGNHQPLMEALQVTGKLSSVNQLIAFGDNEWKEIIKKSGVPEFIKGEREAERIAIYSNQIQTFLNAAYPTRKIAVMIKNKELPIENVNVSEKITAFISQNSKFDIGTTPIHEYVDELKSIAKEYYPEVKKELNRMQRVFQVSPKPEVMGILMEKNLNSAYTISSIPKKSFIKMYGEALGGNLMAETVYQRAEHVSTLAAERAIKMYELSHLDAPAFAYSKSDREEVLTILQNQVSKRHNPNYSEIFGSPDMCECDQCRSVYSAAAYFVELLRFLWRGDKNEDRTPVIIEGITVNFPDGKSPLDKFSERRPDLLHLQLTCENTNTIIPYIDLVNEVMEYYTYHNALSSGAAYNTGSTTTDELRANPQNFKIEAYEKLKDAVYPFNLPYHQPLDVIRTYSDHLKTERYEVMKAMQKQLPTEPEIATAAKAIEAEALRISEEEYIILTKKKFEGSIGTKQLQEYFGFPTSGAPNPALDPIALANLEKIAGTGVTDGIHEFLRRSGLKYTELVELIKTKFINPHQDILEYLEDLFANSALNASTIYYRLQQIKAGTLNPSADGELMAVFSAASISAADFTAWVQEHFDDFKSVIILYQSASMCDLDTTYLRTVQNVYENIPSSGITNPTWSKTHRFIRLWRKLGWTIHEVDLMLAALGEGDITDVAISKLSYVVLLNKQLKIPINKLATLWGSIDTHGDKSLYKTLFLNKAVQRIDQVFEADAFGDYLTGSAILQDHIPAILAAFRISEDDLAAILGVATVTTRIVAEVPAVELTIPNLSAIYCFVIFSKALKLKVPEFCLLAKLFNTTPSIVPPPAVPTADRVFENPIATFNFYELATSIKKAGFKAVVLQYIFDGTLPAESTLGLRNDNVEQVISDIRAAFAAIEQRYPTTPPNPLTADILSSNLFSLSFRADVVNELIGIIGTQQSFSIITDPELGIDITGSSLLASKYNYILSSGRLTCMGVMSDAEKIALKALSGATPGFQNAVDAIYLMPEAFIRANFSDVFAAANVALTDADFITLLNHPAQPIEKTPEEKLRFVYDSSLPLLKQKLHEDAIIQHIALLTGLSQEVTLDLIKDELPAVIASVSIDEFSIDETAKKYHRAGKFISGFVLTDKEVKHFVSYKSDFANIDFKAITPLHWKRINDYVQLRNTVPQAQALLTDVFTAAYITTSPDSTIDTLTTKLHLATAWDLNTIKYLIKATYFNLLVSDFKNEVALLKIYTAVSFVVKTGLSAETLAKWADTATGFDSLNATADLVKRAVKAKYEEEDWLKLAGNLSDKIRESQKQALISYLLTKQELMDWGVTDADGLFEYFLIDVQMGTCMDTSRVVQANAAVQMFVNRCLLNLESVKDTEPEIGLEIGVAPDAIDKDRWEWMKHYRVWEVNRKIFLYPENWLEPEWRDDRSAFFKELESELTQNDITDRSVETAFRNYLTKLNTIANLDVCGMYQENYEGGTNMKFLHVFGRTHNAPYQFFYRTCNNFFKWSAWEKVQVDIRMTEAGEDSGVHLTPIVWKNRLFIFWTEFIEKQEESTETGSRTIRQNSEETVVSLKPQKYWEARLAWSENIDGKWSPKQLSKEFITIKSVSELKKNNVILSCQVYKNSDVNVLHIHMYLGATDLQTYFGTFMLSDIQSKIETKDTLGNIYNEFDSSNKYKNNYEKHSSNSTLLFWDNTYLQNSINHNVIFSNNILEKEEAPADPFFYQALNRTYFVRPIDISPLDVVRSPDNYFPTLQKRQDAVVVNSLPDKSLKTSGFVMTANTTKSKTLSEKSNSKIPQGNKTGGEAILLNGKIEIGNPANLANVSIIGNSFSGGPKQFEKNYYEPIPLEKGFEFHTFHHPYSSQFVTNLNKGGMKELMDSDTNRDYNDSSPTHFDNDYDPNFESGLVKQAPLSNDYKAGEAYTYYKENICFDVYGANSLYNWELFFHAPLYIATRLSKNGKFEEAMKWFHYIFDPTTNKMPLAGQSETSRYWKTLPFKTTPAQTLEEWFSTIGLGANTNPASENSIIAEWRNNPFKPFVVARNRPLAFMKNVVIKYVENIRAWGDSLFRMFTRESVNEALQLYVIANHILGPRPEFVPKRGEIKAETYDSLKLKWDDFSNALVELENIFPYSSSVPVSSESASPGLLGIGPALYFCIPGNEKLIEHLDTIADRLFKIRHCMDIDGVERHLALFSPPIDPAMLINAAAQGISLGSILSDISSPPPIYRFTYLMQKANEFCGEVKSLGNNLLSVLEKKDGEALSRLRAEHETIMLDLMTAIKERQVLDAKANKEGLLKSRETAIFRLKHYFALLSEESIDPPPAPTIDANINSESQLPVDTSIAKIETDVDESLVDSDEGGVKLIPREKQQIEDSVNALISQGVATGMEAIAGILNLLPNATVDAKPFGIGAGMTFGGSNFGAATSALAKVPQIVASIYSHNASQAAQMASYIRREQEWTLLANLAAKEIIQLDKQITSADIKIQISQKELSNHKQQIENSKQVEQYLKDKFTNQELYQWMKEQLFSVYRQSYNMAYDMAKKVEKCYRYELGNEVTSFIQYGYWDNTMQGLGAGEKLQLALRQLEKSYLEENKRELELAKSISMVLLNPLSLQELRTTGKCILTIPEELYDLDYQGHYFRRIKSVSLSLPCIAGPYTTVNCTLRLLKNSVRINTSMKDGTYEHNHDNGAWIDDDRFRDSNVPVKAMATSTGQRDSGMFELNFRDERYLPFEGAGAISEWKIELIQDIDLRQFDYSTISDVILHINYTAREDTGSFKEGSVVYLKNFLTNVALLSTQPLMRMFSMKHEFSTEWHQFLHPSVEDSDQILSVTLQKEHFPFFTKYRSINVKKVDVLIKANRTVVYIMDFAATDLDDDAMTFSGISMPESATYANMQIATLTDETIDVFKQITFKFKHNPDGNYHSLDSDPEEISDLFVVIHYALG